MLTHFRRQVRHTETAAQTNEEEKLSRIYISGSTKCVFDCKNCATQAEIHFLRLVTTFHTK
jgi:hypothetical protein